MLRPLLMAPLAWLATTASAASSLTLKTIDRAKRTATFTPSDDLEVSEGDSLELHLEAGDELIEAKVLATGEELSVRLSAAIPGLRPGTEVAIANRKHDFESPPQKRLSGKVARTTKRRVQVDFPDIDLHGLDFDAKYQLQLGDHDPVPVTLTRLSGKQMRLTFLARKGDLNDAEVGESAVLDLSEKAAAPPAKHVHLSVGAGDIMGLVPGGGVEASYIFGPRLQLGLGYLAGQTSLTPTGSGGYQSNNLTVSASLIQVRLRIFITKSLNTGLTVGSLAVQSHTSENNSVSGQVLNQGTQLSERVLGFYAGSRWPITNTMTFTLDWLGVVFPISYSATTTTTSDESQGAPESAAAQDVQKKTIAVGKGPAYQGLVSLGWQF